MKKKSLFRFFGGLLFLTTVFNRVHNFSRCSPPSSNYTQPIEVPCCHPITPLKIHITRYRHWNWAFFQLNIFNFKIFSISPNLVVMPKDEFLKYSVNNNTVLYSAHLHLMMSSSITACFQQSFGDDWVRTNSLLVADNIMEDITI